MSAPNLRNSWSFSWRANSTTTRVTRKTMMKFGDFGRSLDPTTKTGGFQMKRPNRLLHATLVFCTAACAFPLIVNSSIPPERDDDELEEIVTTGMRVGQGGAQDIN